MIDILVKNNNSVVINNKSKHLIMQYSSGVDSFRVLVQKEYNSEVQDMSQYKCVMEYLLPCTKKYRLVELEKIKPDDPSNSGGDYPDEYADFVKYRIPVGTDLTSEPGDVEVQFSFARRDYEEWDIIIRRTDKAKITITPITEWGEVRIDVFNRAIDEIVDEEDYDDDYDYNYDYEEETPSW